MTEKLKLLDQVIRVLLFLALFLDKPVKALHSSEIIAILRGLVDRIDEARHILLMLQTFLKGIVQFFQDLVRLGNFFKVNFLAIIVQVSPHQHGVIPLFLRLDIIPVGKAIKASFLIEISKIQIQISGIDFTRLLSRSDPNPVATDIFTGFCQEKFYTAGSMKEGTWCSILVMKNWERSADENRTGCISKPPVYFTMK